MHSLLTKEGRGQKGNHSNEEGGEEEENKER